jgi:glycogen operon protein
MATNFVKPPSRKQAATNGMLLKTITYRLSRGRPLPLGASLRRHGVNFSVFSRNATWCTLVLYRPESEQPFLEFPLDPQTNRTGQIWHGFVEGLDARIEYGYRFDMYPNPNPLVHRFDSARVVLDPYARALSNS